MSVFRVLIAIGVGLALADASVVTLALPPMLLDLDTTVEGVAAVIGVYTLVLAAALPGAAWLRRRVDDRTLGAAGLALFASRAPSPRPRVARADARVPRAPGRSARRPRSSRASRSCAAAGCGRPPRCSAPRSGRRSAAR